MDEADKLCDRIAIVDHGELKALDSPIKLKMSIPGKNALEVSFSAVPAGWARSARGRCPFVDGVSGDDGIFRINTTNGPGDDPRAAGSCRTGEDDRALADRPEHDARRCVRALHGPRAARRAPGTLGRRQPVHAPERLMGRTLAIVEREMRRFRRSPMLIVVSMVFPIVQLVVLGYAFGGNVKHLKVAIVNQDRGLPAVQVRELATAAASGARTIDTIEYADSGQALTDLRNGRVNGVLTIPPDFSRRVLAKNEPRVALIEDNTDTFVSTALAATMGGMIASVRSTGYRAAHRGSADARRRGGLSVRPLRPVSAARARS